MILSNKVAIIVQARMGSRRLPSKSTMSLGEYCLLEWVILRLSQFFSLSQIVIAVPDGSDNEILANCANKYGVHAFRGSEDDVLARYVGATTEMLETDYIIRVCADNPFISGALLAEMANFCFRRNLDFVHTLHKPPRYPYIDGMGAEMFTKKILSMLDRNVKDIALREHVTLAVHQGKTSIEPIGMPTPKEYSSYTLKIDLDTLEDYRRISLVIDKFRLNPLSSDSEIIKAFSE